MVLESLIKPIKAEQRPWQMLFAGFLFTLISVFLSMIIFREYASLIMVFLIVLVTFPLVYNTIRLEEVKDEESTNEKALLKEHMRALSVFMFLFLGIMVAFILLYVFLPTPVADTIFQVQLATIQNINGNINGNAITGSYFQTIFFNNMRVLSICILFSFLFGVGAMFILTWNASVIAAAVGNFIKTNLSLLAANFGSVPLTDSFSLFSVGIMKYMIHGFFEILSYFIAGLAGGIISIAIIRHQLGEEKFEKIIFDVSELLVISILILVFAGLVEVYVTPVLF